MMELVHMTAAYSNAMLVAILPHVSEFAKKLDLQVPQPITVQQVHRFNPSPYIGRVEGALWLTNHCWFLFDYRGYVSGFRSPDDWFFEQDPSANLTNYLGQTRMTSSETVAFARQQLLNLGYGTEITRADTVPKVEGPYNPNRGGHVPYCRVKWRSAEEPGSDNFSDVQVDINTQEKSVVGLYLLFARTNKIGTPLKLDVEPELESAYRKKPIGTMFTRTNAPARITQPNAPAPTKRE
jgi:hypothetical protein